MAYNPKASAAKSIPLSQVVFKQEFYPRDKPRTSTRTQYADALEGGAEFPPIELDVDGNVLLDGYHRWKAHEDVGRKEIQAKLIKLNGMPRRLYAARCNGRHGDRLTASEKKAIAREMIEDRLCMIQEDVATALGVSRQCVSNWVGDIMARERRSRDSVIWWLSVLGWPQVEIGERVGLTAERVRQVTQEMPNMAKLVSDQLARGRTVSEIADYLSVDQSKIVSKTLGQLSDLIKGLKEQVSRGRTLSEIAEGESVTTGLIEALTLKDLDDAAARGARRRHGADSQADTRRRGGADAADSDASEPGRAPFNCG
jgi:predicted transcriptional regulator